MITYSGVLVTPENDACPTIPDIAVGLSRTCRWTGSLRIGWSVLQHSLAIEHYAWKLKSIPSIRLLALLHDAHEVITGDIPTTWKCQQMKELQIKLDARIFKSVGISVMRGEMTIIRGYDNAMLWAEARLFGNDAHKEYYKDCPRDLDAEDAIRQVQEGWVSKRAQIARFIDLVENLRTAG